METCEQNAETRMYVVLIGLSYLNDLFSSSVSLVPEFNSLTYSPSVKCPAEEVIA